MHNLQSLPSPACASDWIRIFATQFARRRPNDCASEILAVAMAQFRRCAAQAPEVAAAELADGLAARPRSKALRSAGA